MSEGWTNVRSIIFGRGVVDGIARDLGRFLVTTMPVPWELTRSRLGGWPCAVLMADSMEAEVLERQLESAPPAETIVAIGGGRAVDLGKYIAWRRNCRLVTIPTALTVDAFVTPAAGIRRGHKVEYVGVTSPDPLVIDYDLLRTAPRQLNVAGVGDLLSIQTATRDWELAHSTGRDRHDFSEEQIHLARRILGAVYDEWREIRDVTDRGLRTIVEGYMNVNTICLPAGHYRIEEGSEHFLFYELEERMSRSFIHGQIVGLGIYLMSRLQQNEADRISRLMEDLGLKYHPADLGIDRMTLEASLRNLRSYVMKRGYWYTVIDEQEMTDTWINENLDTLRF
jgi:glycerol-1-phosphate dehydrogenase [NAD(P)+]